MQRQQEINEVRYREIVTRLMLNITEQERLFKMTKTSEIPASSTLKPAKL